MIDSAKLYDTYCEEVPPVDRSQQGAMAFAVEAMKDVDQRTLDDMELAHNVRLSTIEECAAYLESQGWVSPPYILREFLLTRAGWLCF
jgi:hypothetical protein